MQAVRWFASGDVRLDEVERPELRPRTAIVEVSFCGLCGTDVAEYVNGPKLIRPGPHDLTGQAPPITLGHELSGRVVEIDGDHPGVGVGTRVAVDPCLRCGDCRWCRVGEYHICARGGSIGLASDGGLAAFVRVPVEGLCPVPDGVSDEFAAMAEPLAVGLHAATRAGVGPGDQVLVMGAGPIGLAAVLGAQAAGAATIFVSEPNAGRRKRALAVGATEAFDPGVDDVRREVFVRTGRIGPDVVLDGTGRPEAIALGIRSLRRGGRMAVAGISDAALTVDIRELVLYERTISGSLGYNFDIPRVLGLIACGRLDPTPLLTDVRPLADTSATFAELATPTNDQVKVLITLKEN